MLMKSRSMLLGFAAAGMLAACGQSEDAPTPPESTAEPVVPAPLPPEAAAAAPPPVAVQPTDNMWTSAPLTVRATLANLRLSSRGRNEFTVATTLRFENGSDKAIALAMPGPELDLLLDNGMRAAPSYRNDISVFVACGNSLQYCLERNRNLFVDIDPGSSLDVNVSFHGEYNDVTLPELKSVSKGVMNFRIFLLDPGSANRALNVSLSNIPLTNRIE